MSVMRLSKQLKQSIHEGIESNKFNIGEPMKEREITKLAINTKGRDRAEEMSLASKNNSLTRH